MVNSTSDYYTVLGISHSFDKNELRDAFRKKALDNHPDRLKDLPDDERQRREDFMYRVNEAYRTLSNPSRRSEYDRTLREQRSANAEGISAEPSGSVRRSDVSYKDFFTSIFGTENILNMNWDGFWGRQTVEKGDDIFMIPETDWGFLVALQKAYESKTDGKWRVRKMEGDKRSWMPDEVYSVKKVNGEVSVFRRIIDWRSSIERDREIEVKDRNNPFRTEKKMEADAFLGEYYLCNEGKNRLRDQFDIPYSFGEYLQAMKSLARKLATKETNEGKYQVFDEVEIINRYGQFGSRNTREVREGESRSPHIENNYDVVTKVTFDNFWKRLEEAEGTVIQVEGQQTTKEKQNNPPEGTGAIGETLG